MTVDESILEHIGSGQSLPTLRLYAWEPACLSLGHAQPFADVDRARAFRNPAPAHRGEVVVTVPGATSREWYRDWTTPRDRFHVRFEFERLAGRTEPLVVELEPAAAAP